MLNKNLRNNSAKVSEVHRANIQKRLEHRLEVARANGDQNLIRVLENELRQL